MHRILVVAHKTLGGPHLLEEVGRRMQGRRVPGAPARPGEPPDGRLLRGVVHAAAEKVLARRRAADPRPRPDRQRPT